VLTSILQKHPRMRGILFDIEHVIAGAIPRLEQAGVNDRCSTATGDFFKAVPEGGDAYIMKHIIHDWDDERALKILANIRKAMKPGGRIILLESVLASSNEPDFGKLIDLEMLVMPGGRERTADEFRALFQRAGFTVTKIVPTKSPLSVIEAR
jgi:O-methyltransferase